MCVQVVVDGWRRRSDVVRDASLSARHGRCPGVIVTARCRCRFVAGFLLTEAWLVVACRLAATSSSSVDVPAPRRRDDDVDAVVYLVCGVLHSVCGASAFISASLYLVLLATYPDGSAARLLLLLQYCTNHCITAVCLFYARQQYRQVLLSAY